MNQTDQQDSGNVHVRDDYLVRVAGVNDGTKRLASQHRAVCDTLRRTAEALRRLADASRR